MNDRPTADELLEAVQEYLRDEVAPEAPTHRARFRALIAANVVAIVRRELARHDDPQEEPAAIADVLGEPVPVGAARRVRSVRGREGNGLRGMARCAPRECHHATAAELPGIGCPVALVRASEGFHPRSPPLFGRRTLERLHACIRLHRDVVLSGATHSSMLFNRDG